MMTSILCSEAMVWDIAILTSPRNGRRTSDMQEDTNLSYFHGALMDQDADAMLQNEGDFLIQSRHSSTAIRQRMVIAIRTKDSIKRIDIRRNENGVRLGGKTFPNLKKMVEYYSKEPIVLQGGEELLLKKAVPKGKFQLVHSDVRLLKKIGSGAYGTVYRGQLIRENNRTIAVKRIDSEGTDEQALAEMMKEARVMQLNDHKHIVKFFGFIVDRMPYLLVMEYCDGGSVEDKLRAHPKRITIPMRVDMSTQGSYGLEYLHSRDCIHRDIATRNCLIDKGIVKLADFGMCRATNVYKIDLSKPLNVRWLAPEVWRNGETRYNTDIYAYGVLLWEMFEIPYNSPYAEWKAYTVKQKVMGGYRMPPPRAMPEEMVAVMELAWNHDPEKRPDATGLRKLLEEVNKKYCSDDEQSKTKSVLKSRA
nr:SH2 motif and Tyrosine protein kinase domain containing protein [Haemonchus contortus]